jgi:hypothetical protein
MVKRDPVKPRVALDLVALVIRPAGTLDPHDGAEEKRGTTSPKMLGTKWTRRSRRAA